MRIPQNFTVIYKSIVTELERYQLEERTGKLLALFLKTYSAGMGQALGVKSAYFCGDAKRDPFLFQ
ncbi:MAG TPA: hypothetical protein V6D11_29665 [Waterburya sp.]|jgi:hypothetical protein